METENRSERGFTRRSLCIGACGAFAALVVGGLKFLPADAKVRPPGGQDENRLLSLCIRCMRCIESCPWNLLRSAHVGEGILSSGLPVADFNRNWCDLCSSQGGSPLCVSACPTGALELPQDGSKPILGKAVIVQDWCIPWATGQACKRCNRACPHAHHAIKLDKQGRPSVDEEKCIGCGACQKACVKPEDGSLAPSEDLRAIMVVPA